MVKPRLRFRIRLRRNFEVLGCILLAYTWTHKYNHAYKYTICIYTFQIHIYLYVRIMCIYCKYLYILNILINKYTTCISFHKTSPHPYPPSLLLCRTVKSSISESKRMLWNHKCRKAWRTVLKLMTSTGVKQRLVPAGWNKTVGLDGTTRISLAIFLVIFLDSDKNGRMTWNDCVFRAQEEVLFGAQFCWSACDILEMISSPKKQLSHPTRHCIQLDARVAFS